ncbi:MAG: hypothetical protein MI799_00855, partial [Desulfobacterales bacterium]|nr:hypothetical protein [Desulfobacterales bacterium]
MSNSGKFQDPFPFLTFEYGAVQIKEAGYIGTTPYFTRRVVGEWLRYQDPKSAIARIIKKNPHIENPEWATVVRLTTVEGNRPVTRTTEIYSPIGLQLIVFEL